MNKQQTCINNLLKLVNLANDELKTIKELNLESQFDYCTSPKFATTADDLYFIVSRINDIVYQK
ncbi:MAG: hypothetical protein WCO84_00895 [bacterium]